MLPVARAEGHSPCCHQQVAAGCGGFDRELAVDAAALHQALIDGVFPDGQPRTAGLPGVHDVAIASRAGRDPFHEIEHEGIRAICHAGKIAIPRRHIQYMG